MKADKIGMWLINLLISAAFAFSLLVLMEQLPAMGWAWYSRSLRALPVLICFAAGLLGRRLGRLRYALLPLSAACSAVVIWLLLPEHEAMDIVYVILCVFIGAGMFLLGLRGDRPFPSRVALATIAIYVFDCAYFYLNTGVVKEIMPVTYCALGAFLLSLYSFNTNSLHSGLHNVKGGAEMTIPAGLRSRNIVMLTVFLVIAVPLASLSFLHRGLSSCLGFIIGCIGSIIGAIFRERDTSNPVQIVEESKRPVDPGPALEPGEGGGVFVPVFIVVMLIMALIFAIVVFVPKADLRGGKGGLRDWLKKLFAVKQVEAYEDSVERLLDLKGLLRRSRDSVKSFVAKLRTVPEKYEDMPDSRMRVRFAYKFLLRSSRVNNRALYYTPDELSAELEMPEVDALARAYDLARYSERSSISEEHEAAARAAMSAIRSRKK